MFVPTIFKPTRVTKSSCTLIDNIFVHDYKNVFDPTNCVSGVIVDDMSDHFAACIVNLEGLVQNIRTSREVVYRKINDELLFKIRHELLHTDWSLILNGDVNSDYDTFLTSVTNCLNRHAPLKTKTIDDTKFGSRPWFNKSIEKCIRKSKKLYKESLSNPCDKTQKKYKSYRNALNRLIRSEKKLFYDKKFNEYKSAGDVTWSLIKDLIGKHKDKSCIITQIRKGDLEINDPSNICKTINSHFSSVYDRISSNIPPTTKNHMDFLKGNSDVELSLNETTDFEIDKIIDSLKNKTSYGLDGILNKLIKDLKVAIRTPLKIICNKSMNSGVFPESMKTAKVIPLFKSGSRSCLDNYRPISLLPCFSKILERIVLTRYKTFMKKNNQYYVNQFGFRENSSTIHACQCLATEILECYESGSILASVFIDVKKAFDSVSKEILNDKLAHYGIQNTTGDWFDSYLTNRKQCTIVNDHMSDVEILSGCIAQGSILGPELFLTFVNDIYKSLRYSTCILFADDTTIYLIGNSLRFIRTKLQSDINSIIDWISCNKLVLNAKKTKMMLFCKETLSYDDSFSIKMLGIPIEITSKFKFLGIMFDSKLDFTDHANAIINSLRFYNFKLKKSLNFLSDHCKEIYFHAFIQSRIDYRNLIWFPHLNKFVKSKLGTLYN